MKDNTKAVMTKHNGLFINIDGAYAKFFIQSICADIIAECRNAEFKPNKYNDLELKLNNNQSGIANEYGSYCEDSFNHLVLSSKADILYSIVDECVFNKSVSPLWLFYENNFYNIIVDALESYDKLCCKSFNVRGKEIPYDRKSYSKNNKEFLRLFKELK